MELSLEGYVASGRVRLQAVQYRDLAYRQINSNRAVAAMTHKTHERLAKATWEGEHLGSYADCHFLRQVRDFYGERG